MEMIAETLFGFGCYVGEFFVRNGHGQWARPTAEQAGLVGFPFIVRASADSWLNPIGKTFKRYENGEEDSVSDFLRDPR